MNKEEKVSLAIVGSFTLLMVAGYVGFWGFIIWVIYKLVIHFTS